MKFNSISRLLMLFLTCVSPSVFALGAAQSVINTTIASIDGNGKGLFVVRMNGVYTNPPPCANAAAMQFVVSAETKAGKAIIATILMAQASGKVLGIQGAGTCNIAPSPPGQGTEDIYYVYTS